MPGNVSASCYWQEHAEDCEAHALDVRAGTVIAPDGYALRVFDMGSLHERKIMLLNSPGMPFFVMARLAWRLAESMHVIAVESRGCPEEEDRFESSYVTIDRQSDDVLAVATARAIGQCDAVTWSSGAFVLLDAMRKRPSLFRSKIMLAPNDLTDHTIETGFQRFFFPLFRQAAQGDTAQVERLRSMVRASQRAIEHAPALERRGQTLSTLFCRSAEAARRYAHYFQGALDFRAEAKSLYAQLSKDHAFHFIHASNDTFTDYRESVAAYAAAQAGTLTIHKSGGHLVMYTRDTLVCAAIHGCFASDAHDAALQKLAACPVYPPAT
jgi:pimeloyl-ACP methyl ester carboxylesterase